MSQHVGSRLRCESCGSEAIITKADAPPQLTCCGRSLISVMRPAPQRPGG